MGNSLRGRGVGAGAVLLQSVNSYGNKAVPQPVCVCHGAMSAASAEPPANRAQKASFFSMTASLTSGVRQQVLKFLPWQALMTFWPKLLTTASTMDALNMVHFNWMSPAAYPATWSDSPPSSDQLTALPISSPQCPEHTVGDHKTQLSSWSGDYHPLTYSGLAPSTLMSHLMFKHGVSCGKSVPNVSVHLRSGSSSLPMWALKLPLELSALQLIRNDHRQNLSPRNMKSHGGNLTPASLQVVGSLGGCSLSLHPYRLRLSHQ